MLEARSSSHVVHSDLDVKFWMEGPPPTARVRPATCPGCGVAARPLGARLHVVGHGVRERQVRGPLHAGGPPGLVVVRVRRFRCRVCGAVITVLPRGVAPRRHFGLGLSGAPRGARGRALDSDALHRTNRACDARVASGIAPGGRAVLLSSGGWWLLRLPSRDVEREGCACAHACEPLPVSPPAKTMLPEHWPSMGCARFGRPVQ